MIERRPLALAVLIGADMLLLLGLRLNGQGGAGQGGAGQGGALELGLQAVLVVALAALSVLDLRVATAIAVLELAVAGASGRWTVFPGGISGRIVIDAVVFAVALARLAAPLLRGERPRLGRYGPHALAVAIILPGLWIPLGLINGSRPGDAWGDGNGYLFLAFALVLAALAAQADLGWLRRWLLVCCSVTATLTATAAVAMLAGLVSVHSLHMVLLNVLDMGGVVSRIDGNLRLSLGSALYLPVGLALLTWELVERPRRIWPWLLLLVFVVALAATYTRALWLTAALVVIVVTVASATNVRRLALVAGALVLIGGAATLGGWMAGVSVPDYVISRLATTFVLPDDSAGAYSHEPGVISNAIKVRQARVLLGHIAERPITGWGFGAIAPDYPYGRIYSYELSYLALAYKAGIPGLLLFLSLPLRLVIDSVRVRLRRLRGPAQLSVRAAAVPLAVVLALLLIGAVNPYLVAAFGLAPLVLSIAWLDPFDAP